MDITLERIVSLLKQQGKKQKDLTDFLGITRHAFTDWKSGRIKSYQKHIPKIAEFLGVSTDYLLGKENSPLSCDNELSPTQKELIALFDSAAPELQSAVLAVLKVHAVQTRVPDADEATK